MFGFKPMKTRVWNMVLLRHPVVCLHATWNVPFDAHLMYIYMCIIKYFECTLRFTSDVHLHVHFTILVMYLAIHI